MTLRFAILLMGTAAAPPAGQQQADSPPGTSINLICGGHGSANRFASSTGFITDNKGNSAVGNVLSQRAVGYDDQVIMEIPENGRGRIRMPRALLPAIRGGKNGWFSINSIRKSENEITGVVQVSVLNSPKLRLDRITGHINISGKSGDYSGSCEPFDPATAERKF